MAEAMEAMELSETEASADAASAPPAATQRFPKPRGYAPKIDGVEAMWDDEVGCWRKPDGGGEHTVAHNAKAKAETAKAKAKEEQLRLVREAHARRERELSEYREQALEGMRAARASARAYLIKKYPEKAALFAARDANRRAIQSGGPYTHITYEDYVLY